MYSDDDYYPEFTQAEQDAYYEEYIEPKGKWVPLPERPPTGYAELDAYYDEYIEPKGEKK